MNEFAGTLRERIVIDRLVSVRDAMGLQQPGWEQVCSCLASIVLESVGQESEGQALSAMSRFRIAIRRREGLSVGHRVRWSGRTLTVRQLLDDPQAKDRLTMRCEEVRA